MKPGSRERDHRGAEDADQRHHFRTHPAATQFDEQQHAEAREQSGNDERSVDGVRVAARRGRKHEWPQERSEPEHVRSDERDRP